jgi:hypothetical protein
MKEHVVTTYSYECERCHTRYPKPHEAEECENFTYPAVLMALPNYTVFQVRGEYYFKVFFILEREAGHKCKYDRHLELSHAYAGSGCSGIGGISLENMTALLTAEPFGPENAVDHHHPMVRYMLSHIQSIGHKAFYWNGTKATTVQRSVVRPNLIAMHRAGEL